jgi:hypothetical protein
MTATTPPGKPGELEWLVLGHLLQQIGQSLVGRAPKSWLGWTFNYAHPVGVRYFHASILFALAVFLGSGLAIGWLIGQSR